jgi:multiple sugar transport system substrate-binding protein
VGLRHYLKLLRDQELSPNNLKENSAQSADRFVRAEQLIIFGTSELIRKIEFDTDLGGLMDSPLAKDGIITVAGPKGPFGNHSFVGGSHLTLPKNANPIKRNSAYDLFLFMLRADNIDYYSRQCGFIPPDRGLIRIWMQDPRYNHLIEGLENHGRSTQNIPEWSEIEMSVNGMVSAIAASLLKNAPDVDDEIARFVFDTHQKINSILGYNSPETVAAVKERVRKSLLQPVDEFKYAKGLGVVKGESEWSIRLIVVISLGVLAVAMMLVYAFRIRKH